MPVKEPYWSKPEGRSCPQASWHFYKVVNAALRQSTVYQERRGSQRRQTSCWGPGFCRQTSAEGKQEHNGKMNCCEEAGQKRPILVYLGILILSSHPNPNHLYLEPCWYILLVSVGLTLQLSMFRPAAKQKNLQLDLKCENTWPWHFPWLVPQNKCFPSIEKHSPKVQYIVMMPNTDLNMAITAVRNNKRWFPHFSGWMEDSQRTIFLNCLNQTGKTETHF